jgi:cytochrome c oxidase cbb3-type subunit 3
MTSNPRNWRNWYGWRTWPWSVRLAVLAVAIAVLWLAAHFIHGYAMQRQLLSSYPDEIPKNVELMRYASALAEPAYAANCASCHGAHLEGDSKIGAPNLKDQDWLYDDGRVAQIEELILYGIRAGHGKTRSLTLMPAFGTPVPSKTYAVPPLQPQQIRDVVQYLLKLAGRPHDELAAGRGHGYYANEGSCFDCHSEDAQGNSAVGAPDLVDRIWLYGNGTPEDIYQSIAEGRHGVCPAWVDHLPLLTIRALAVYLYDQSHPAKTSASISTPISASTSAPTSAEQAKS